MYKIRQRNTTEINGGKIIMNVKDKVFDIVEQYTKKTERLKEQEKATFDEIYKLNSEIIQLENKKHSVMMDDDSLDINELSKINSKIYKINEKIKENRESITLIRQAAKELEERYKEKITPLHKELHCDYMKQLRDIGLQTQKIVDNASLKQLEMWDVQKEFSGIVSEMNSIGNNNFNYSLPLVDVMRDSTANVFKLIPFAHVEDIRKHGIEWYNLTYSRYGRFIR